MKGRSSSKQGRVSKVVGVSMEKDAKVDKVKEEPHLSGAYIRSLVKHLSSTRTKDSINGDANLIPKPDGECFSDHNNMQPETPSPPPPLQQPPHKKQVRRRQHTTKPYQERLLNMAEARKEIVTALKYHRASKQESSNTTLDIKSSSQTHPQSEQSPCTTTNFSNHYPSLSCPPSIPYYWPIPTIIPPPLPPPYHENVNFALPSQTLGLNLNFHDFKNLDANLYHNPLSNSSTSSSASSCSSTSTSSSAAISEAVVPMPEEVTTNSSSGSDLHHAMDEYEMEEIRSLGEQHQIEWNDRVNLVKSARWFKFLKTIEIGPEDAKVDDGFDFFDQVMEVPSWLMNANEHVVDDHFSDDYLQDASLNCMDIGEIEGMDGEWLV